VESGKSPKSILTFKGVFFLFVMNPDFSFRIFSLYNDLHPLQADTFRTCGTSPGAIFSLFDSRKITCRKSGSFALDC
jgi:hypothetical protein